MRNILHFALGAVLCTVLFCDTTTAAAKKKVFHDTPPDLTKGGQPDDTRDWRLGPLGANGWVFNRATRAGASREARQILITRVDKGAPADGKLKVGDVILGVNGRAFTTDARKALACAINEAEKKANKGRLRLTVWRAGKEKEINLTLKVMGSSSLILLEIVIMARPYKQLGPTLPMRHL